MNGTLAPKASTDSPATPHGRFSDHALPERVSSSREERLAGLTQVIAELHDVHDVRRLVDLAPTAVCRLGFDRAMISRVEQSHWLVQRFHSSDDPERARSITESARHRPPALGRNLFEADVIRRRRSILVEDAQNDPRVSPELALSTESRSYVVAPIMPDQEVIGLFHADRFHSGAKMDAFDRELLALFASQFGQLLERAVLVGRLDTLKARVDETTKALSGLVSGCIEGTVNMAEQAVHEPTAAELPALVSTKGLPVHDPDDVLTRREIDVLKLMATGETNSRIASRLVISEGTVKSHVRHILRKLGAANRAEAVCRWLQADTRPAC